MRGNIRDVGTPHPQAVVRANHSVWSRKKTNLPAEIGEFFVDSLEGHGGWGVELCGWRERA